MFKHQTFLTLATIALDICKVGSHKSSVKIDAIKSILNLFNLLFFIPKYFDQKFVELEFWELCSSHLRFHNQDTQTDIQIYRYTDIQKDRPGI